MASREVPHRRDARPLYCLFTATAIGQAGVSIQRFGTALTIVGMGALYLLVTLGAFLDPRLRAMDVSEREALVDQAPDRDRLRTTP